MVKSNANELLQDVTQFFGVSHCLSSIVTGFPVFSIKGEESQVCSSNSDFPLTLARWQMASEHCRRTSDFLSYWPGLDSGISKIAEK